MVDLKSTMKECMLAYALILNHATYTERGEGRGTTADELALHARKFFRTHFPHLNVHSQGVADCESLGGVELDVPGESICILYATADIVCES